MNDLIRPSLYDAHHEIRPVRADEGEATPCDVVGPVCETGDTFARAYMLPPVAEGELVAILNAGAYGAVMASSYNTRPLVPEVLVDGGVARLVRRRVGPEEQIAFDLPPKE
jgi:diaminopimelate decarboxylase